MSSINPGFSSVPIVSSLSGISSAGKQSTTEKSAIADGSASKVVESAHAETGGLMGSEKTADRDADGRQHYEGPAGSLAGSDADDADDASKQPALPRSKDPDKSRGSRLDLDA